jgi:hypothetical protein
VSPIATSSTSSSNGPSASPSPVKTRK